MRLGRIGLATAAAVALVATVALPAQAQQSKVHDGLDTRARAELTDFTVINGPKRVVVVLRFNDLSYLHYGEYPLALFYDTDPVRHGPEYVLPPHFGGIWRTDDRRHWQSHTEQRCFVGSTIHWHIDTFRFVAGRQCFGGDTDSVRVSVVVTEPNPHPRRHDIQDWAPAEKRFGPWTRRG